MLRFVKLSLGFLDVAALLLMGLIMFLTEYSLSWTKTETSLTPQRRRRRTVHDIPGPRPALPILGTRWIYSMFGRYNMNEVHEAYRDMFRQYGTIIREEALWNVPVVSLLERKDIESVLKQSSKYPMRPPIEAIIHYRKSRPDRYTTVGMVNEQGEKWHTLRTLLTPEITSPKTIKRFLPELNQVSEDFISLVKTIRDENDMVAGFEELSTRLGLENTCTVILGRRMGFLDCEVDPVAARLATAIKNHLCASRDTYYGLPFWKVFPTRSYALLEQSEEDIYDIISEFVESALKEEKETCAVDAVRSVFISILNTPELDVRDKKAAIIDFIAAGMQTLGNSLVFTLYQLAKYPRVQEKLNAEIRQLVPGHAHFSAENLKNAPYLQACLLESFRVLPTAPCMARVIESDMELSGYQFPPGSVVVCHTWLACQEEVNFTNAKEFWPERWLQNGELTRSSPFLVVPFGCGRRVCPGKRFVEQQMELMVAMMVRDFKIEFEGELELQFEFVLTPKAQSNFTFHDRQD